MDAMYIELPAKLLDYFLQSNKSNINQTRQIWHSEIVQVTLASGSSSPASSLGLIGPVGTSLVGQESFRPNIADSLGLDAVQGSQEGNKGANRASSKATTLLLME